MNKVHVSKLTFDDEMMWLHLADGRILGVPLNYFPRLQHATPEQRDAYIFSGGGQGLHWEALDEDISVDHLLMGHRDTTAKRIA